MYTRAVVDRQHVVRAGRCARRWQERGSVARRVRVHAGRAGTTAGHRFSTSFCVTAGWQLAGRAWRGRGRVAHVPKPHGVEVGLKSRVRGEDALLHSLHGSLHRHELGGA